jgi:hypothetical protein
MSTDVFGDLREWNRVVGHLEHLKHSGQLDKHQDGLARLLRYRFNWHIREKALQSLSTLSAPEDHILLLVLEIIVDEHTEFDLRTLAADSLCGLISMRQKRDRWSGELKTTVIERLSQTMNANHPAGFQHALKRVIDCARQHERVAAGF